MTSTTSVAELLRTGAPLYRGPPPHTGAHTPETSSSCASTPHLCRVCWAHLRAALAARAPASLRSQLLAAGDRFVAALPADAAQHASVTSSSFTHLSLFSLSLLLSQPGSKVSLESFVSLFYLLVSVLFLFLCLLFVWWFVVSVFCCCCFSRKRMRVWEESTKTTMATNYSCKSNILTNTLHTATTQQNLS